MLLLLLVVLILAGGGWFGYHNYGAQGGIGIGTIILIVALCYLFFGGGAGHLRL